MSERDRRAAFIAAMTLMGYGTVAALAALWDTANRARKEGRWNP